MVNNNNIIQWNCRGLKPNLDEINLLIQKNNPLAICLQETYLKETDKITFKNYSLYSSYSTNAERATGGTSILLHNDSPHSRINLNTNITATAVSVSAHKTITICSIYLSPSTLINQVDLDKLLDQLPTPYLLLGDFNGHNLLWGSNPTNRRGQQVETFINKHDLCILNDNSITYIHPATGSQTAIDLSLCDPSLFLDFTWEVGDDLCGSDHFPIFLKYNGPNLNEKVQRWKLHKADWNTFQELCATELQTHLFEDVDDPISQFSSTLHNIAEQCIPKTSANPKRFNKPWYNDECKEAIRERKKALRDFNVRPTTANLSNFKIFRAKARRTIRQSKKTTWRKYVSKLNSRSTVKTTWDMIRKINGKGKSSKVHHLKTHDGDKTSVQDISNALADAFSKNSSSEQCSEKFRRIKQAKEKVKLKFQSNNNEHYNKHFTIEELQASLKRANDTAVGPDDIHYQLLKHLPIPTLHILLNIFNNIWESGNFPPSWREAIVIPVPKPGKDHTDPTNYRPIALTSCVCKTMERMINERLVWYLESNNLISKEQCGFRRQRSTADHLIRFETFIREAFLKKEHLVAVFFDLEKAYDTTWKYGILNDLHDCGLRGRLPDFISKFLIDREFRVRVGSTLSDLHDQEMGVPQGSILSVTLFNIKINNIVKALKPGTDCSLYVDDFLICYRSKSMATIERQLQQNINNIQNWATNNGFKFSKAKTKCMHFCNLRGMHPDPDLQLDGSPIPVVEEFKFLGLIFDRKLSFIPHIKYLKAKCQKSLDLLRVVSSTNWGADRTVLLRLYRAHIRSKLDYGCMVYGSARDSYLKMLDPIHHQGLRLCLGAFRTSPTESLYVEANELSLANRRNKLAMQYCIKLHSNPDNPAFKPVFEPRYEAIFADKPNSIPTLGIRIKPSLEATGIDLYNIANHVLPEYPPWLLKQPHVIFDINVHKKSFTPSHIFTSNFLQVRERFHDFTFLYTDGSKDDDRVAAAAVFPDGESRCRLPDKSSIFSAELQAIHLALDYVESSGQSKFMICSDSLSSLQALHNSKLDNIFVRNILTHLHILHDKNIKFCWVPSHIGIKGNEQADCAAKAALTLPITPLKVPYSDFKHCITKYLIASAQINWDTNYTHNKLYAIQPKLGVWPNSCRSIRREEVILSRLRIGHTRLTHTYLLKGEAQPMCIPCQQPLTVHHILIDCIDFAHIRPKYYTVPSLKQLFEGSMISSIFHYLEEIGLYNKI